MDKVVPAHVAAGRFLAGRRARLLAVSLAPLLAVLLAALLLPLPFLDGYLAGLVAERVSSQVACPGSLAQPPKITVGGGRLVPQVLRRRMSELRLTLPDVTIGDTRHAGFEATLRDVSQPEKGTTRAGSMDASITVGFANMPTAEGEPPTTYGQAPDGSLSVKTVSPAANAKRVTAKLFLKMELRGQSVAAVPQRLQMFGRTLPAKQVPKLVGSDRVQKLPGLPEGVTYKSITPRKDGVHVALDGVAVEPLSKLPKEVDGRPVTYRAGNGLLGISTAFAVKPIINVPLTIHTAPRLDGGTLTLVPQSVEILGADRPVDSFLSKIVLGQVKQESLSRKLPALPPGVRYRSVSVDSAGIKVAVGGETVRPFSTLSAGDGRPTTFGAENGLLTAVTKGGNPDGSPTPLVLYAKPTIKYRGVEILPEGLRIVLSGKNVLLRKGQLTGGSAC